MNNLLYINGLSVEPEALDGAGGLQGWMERVENLPGVGFEKFTTRKLFSHDWKYGIISDLTQILPITFQCQMMRLI